MWARASPTPTAASAVSAIDTVRYAWAEESANAPGPCAPPTARAAEAAAAGSRPARFRYRVPNVAIPTTIPSWFTVTTTPLASAASGVVVTVNQLGIVVGIATFGTLYLNLAGRLPAAAASAARAVGGAHGPGAFALSSAHAYLTVSIALTALAAVGVGLALAHIRASRGQAAVVQPARARAAEG